MEKSENENVNILDEVNKGATMGMDAVRYVNEKAEDKGLKNTLDVEYDKYKNIVRKVSEVYPKFSDKNPHETNAMTKMMTWYGIQMNTIKDKTTSKLAELLMQGTNMGIIEGRRLLNQHDDTMDLQVKSILNDFVSMQEDSVETLKKFL